MENKENINKEEVSNLMEKIEEQEKKLNQIYVSVEKTRKYFLSMMIVTVVMIVLPLIGIIFIIPHIMGMYADVISF